MEAVGIVGARPRALLLVGALSALLAWTIAAAGSTARGAQIGLEQAKLTAPSTGPDAQLGSPTFGASVVLSADGNTALIGGYSDGKKDGIGAAWVFTRSGGIWTEQQKLAAPGTGPDSPIKRAMFGTSVALSSDGNTALIGGPADNTNVGAAWVFTRSGGVWTERQKLVAPTTGPDIALGPRNPQFGIGVALSADGRRALIGGYIEHLQVGAAWMFVDNGGSWSEQQKLIPPGAGPGKRINRPFFGYSVALSANANQALIGGYGDNGLTGAAWMFTRSGGILRERQKLTAPTSGAGRRLGGASFGSSVALSSDGSTALIGGPSDRAGGVNGFGVGAAWVFTGKGHRWSEQQKLTAPLKHIGNAVFGYSVALSSAGKTALIGAADEGNDGTAWAFERNGRNWTAHELPAPTTGADAATPGAYFGISVALSGDGSTGLVGGYADRMVGAAWTFTRQGSALSDSAIHA
jgi:hypothetical protein